MGQRTVADTIREITRTHLTKNNGLLLGETISAVGWVNNTVPDCQGIVELPMSDVAGSGIAVGAALSIHGCLRRLVMLILPMRQIMALLQIKKEWIHIRVA